MRKLILQEFVTVDGCAAGPNGEIDFLDFLAGDGSKDLDVDTSQMMDSVDTILLGANTYQIFADYWPTATTETEVIADKVNTTPKIIFSKNLAQAPWGKWQAATVVKTDAVPKIKSLKQQAGKNMVLWGSISLAQSLMAAKLIDEYRLQVLPFSFGKGKRLFSDNSEGFNLKLLQAKTYASGLVALHYELGQPVQP